MKDFYPCAGQFRDQTNKRNIRIPGSTHRPPAYSYVEGHIEEMCDFANNLAGDPVKVSAHLMWRLNWIHPSAGGNGRTSRALAYFAFCVGIGSIPPGTYTLGNQVDANRLRYREALEEADEAWKNSSVLELTKMESLINDAFEQQYLSHEKAVQDRGNSD